MLCIIVLREVHICVYVCHTSSFAVVLYAISAVYFAGVMVRLMLTLTPIVCVLAAIAISHSLDNYLQPSSSTDGKTLFITCSLYTCTQHLDLFICMSSTSGACLHIYM